MSETILIPFPDIAGDASTFTAFVRDEAGALLNGAGDVVTEPVPTLRAFTLDEDRDPTADYHVRIYSGSAETADELVYDAVLYAGQLIVGKQWNPTVIRGIVGATSPTTTSFTPSYVSVDGAVVNQWKGRIIVFSHTTVTAALRGQVTDITFMAADALPTLTFTALTTAPVSGDSFVIV